MTKPTIALYAAALFILGAVVALGGEHILFRHKDGRDGMETIAMLQDWRLTCPPRTTKTGSCLIQSGIAQKGTGNVIADLTVSQKDNGDTLTIMAPLGVFIPAGMRLTIGSGISKAIAFKTCVQVGCAGTLPMDSTLASAMTQNNEGQIIVVAEDGRSVPLTFSLRGYKDALSDRAIDMSYRK